MNTRALTIFLRCYVLLILAFVFTPIVASVVFSFNSDRFPTLPLGNFTTSWYQQILSDPDFWEALKKSLITAVCVSITATFIGFGAAYTDYRYRFFGKSAFLAMGLLPPTIPLVIFGLAMLAWLSRINLSGQIYSVYLAHVVMCTPFAMAIIRLRLAQMDDSLEAAAWNLGASQFKAVQHVILPFTLPSVISALCLCAAVSFDEFAVAWFVSGLHKTVPVVIMEILQGQVDPRINAIGTFVFLVSITLVVLAQLFLYARRSKPVTTKG